MPRFFNIQKIRISNYKRKKIPETARFERFLVLGAEGGIWTLAPFFRQPTPLAGEPLRPLGYFRRSWWSYGGESGIRTHGRFHVAGFQDRFLQPLGHLSMKRQECPSFRRLNRIPQAKLFVNKIPGTFLGKYFLKFWKKDLHFVERRANIIKLTPIWNSNNRISGCSAVGSALDWGSRGREFKSRHSDQ